MAGELQFRATDGALLHHSAGADTGKLMAACCCCSETPCAENQCGHSGTHVHMVVTVDCEGDCANLEGTYAFSTFSDEEGYCEWVWSRVVGDDSYYLRVRWDKTAETYGAILYPAAGTPPDDAYFGGPPTDYICTEYACAWNYTYEEIELCCMPTSGGSPYNTFRDGDTFTLTGRADPCNDCPGFEGGDCSGCTATITTLVWWV